ncbi:MAG: 3-keto-5-aminohexanoate cleavage protein [Coprothermobacterota bacterium]|nr:3-keto-5-aminohexanoate cleavage protein [Caldisericota bacterium]MDI6868486.1 3-keto-5-aminohexanoate cleavage protein [Coprothermobacterota bacterium]
MEKLIITVAVCGAEVTKKDNPNLPITPEEITQDVYNCYLQGASMVHLHVRDQDGNPTQNVEIFRRTIELIKSRCNIIIQISTGGAVGMTPEERAAPLVLRPEMASLTCGTVNFGTGVFWNPPDLIENFALRMKEMGIKPEIEVFEAGMINNALQLVKKGLVQPPLHFDFVMGVPGGITGNIRDLVYLVESIPPGSTWSVAGIGRFELPLAVAALIMGGHVRVGFEDNIFYSRGVLAQSNAQLVERVVRIARELGREVATPDEARKILNLHA